MTTRIHCGSQRAMLRMCQPS
ncbi:hypothetical protein IEO21_09999 [Rhodonia placenta]|uniref:Uncharacterized protein n=1 Tax=Rhodonia placenta TaxID=104341 RepID=A0A8H7NTA8_9APHY|nr:hypothetical protein IEO21_09999 [Postia placenta]